MTLSKVIFGIPLIIYSLFILLVVGPQTVYDWIAFLVVFGMGIIILTLKYEKR